MMHQPSWDEIKDGSFALEIYTCGYENRASFVAREKCQGSGQILVLDYQSTGILDYDKNKRFFESIENVVVREIDECLGKALDEQFRNLLEKSQETEEIQVLVDVSSCSRSVITEIFLAAHRTGQRRIRLFCTYALSAFDTPPTSELPSHISEPVVGDLAGWSDDLSKPPCAIIGLGFEPGRALGCVDYLEIPKIKLLLPEGPDERFEQAVREANSQLIDEADEFSILGYDVLRPDSIYQKLASMVAGLLPDFRPVIIPLGPKIFAAVSILLAISLLPKVCVWRTSSGPTSDPQNIQPSGEIAVFSFAFSSNHSPNVL